MKGGIWMPYIITEKTIALLPSGKETKILELDQEKIQKESITKILEYNCNLNGSTLEGRRKGSSYLIGASYKPPIIMDELKRIILIPTHSSKNPNCCWFVLENILKYSLNKNHQVTILFKNHQKLDLNVCYANFDKQVLRAMRLESAIRGRKHIKNL